MGRLFFNTHITLWFLTPMWFWCISSRQSLYTRSLSLKRQIKSVELIHNFIIEELVRKCVSIIINRIHIANQIQIQRYKNYKQSMKYSRSRWGVGINKMRGMVVIIWLIHVIKFYTHETQTNTPLFLFSFCFYFVLLTYFCFWKFKGGGWGCNPLLN